MVFRETTFRDLFAAELARLREVNHCHGTGTKGHPCGPSGQWRRTLRQRTAPKRAKRIFKSLDAQMRQVHGDVGKALKIRKRMDKVAKPYFRAAQTGFFGSFRAGGYTGPKRSPAGA